MRRAGIDGSSVETAVELVFDTMAFLDFVRILPIGVYVVSLNSGGLKQLAFSDMRRHAARASAFTSTPMSKIRNYRMKLDKRTPVKYPVFPNVKHLSY